LAPTGRSSYEQEIAVLVGYSAHRTIRDSNHIQCGTWSIATTPRGAPVLISGFLQNILKQKNKATSLDRGCAMFIPSGSQVMRAMQVRE